MSLIDEFERQPSISGLVIGFIKQLFLMGKQE